MCNVYNALIFVVVLFVTSLQRLFIIVSLFKKFVVLCTDTFVAHLRIVSLGEGARFIGDKAFIFRALMFLPAKAFTS